jgi:hypothetical protein
MQALKPEMAAAGSMEGRRTSNRDMANAPAGECSKLAARMAVYYGVWGKMPSRQLIRFEFVSLALGKAQRQPKPRLSMLRYSQSVVLAGRRGGAEFNAGAQASSAPLKLN